MIWPILIALALLSAADVATTVYALSRGYDEANPIFARLFARLSPAGVAFVGLGVKLAWVAVTAAILLTWPYLWWTGLISAAGLAFVVFSNVRTLRS